MENLFAAAYMCDANGLIMYFNYLAVRLWGREPKLNSRDDRYCGSFKFLRPDGSPLNHADSWIAKAIFANEGYTQEENIMQRLDGSRRNTLAYANPPDGSLSLDHNAINTRLAFRKRFGRRIAFCSPVDGRWF